MPLSPSGVYTLPGGYLAVTGQDILPSQHNPPLEDIASVLSEAFYRTGVAPMLANLNMNTFKLLGVGNGTAATDGVNKGQLDGLAVFPSVGVGKVLRMTNGLKMQFWSANNVSGFDTVNFLEPFSSFVLGIFGQCTFSIPATSFIGVSCNPINLVGFIAHARAMTNGGGVGLATNTPTQYMAIGV